MKNILFLIPLLFLSICIAAHADNYFNEIKYLSNWPPESGELNDDFFGSAWRDGKSSPVLPTSGSLVKLNIGMTQFIYTGLNVEGEFTKLWNETLSNSVAVGYVSSSREHGGVGFGRSGEEWASALNLDFNTFHTTYALKKRYAFKIGVALSAMYLQNRRNHLTSYLPDGEAIKEYRTDRNVHVGGGVVMEHEYAVSEKYVVGVKGFAKLYNQRREALGVQLKFGVRLGK